MKKQDIDISLEKKIIEIYDRHNVNAKRINWNFYEYMPYEIGRNFVDDPWKEEDKTLPEEIIIALETSMLTELNLPWYTAYLNELSKNSLGVLKDFLHTWTSEEAQHANALESYLILTRNSQPSHLSDIKKELLFTGWEPILMNTAFETVVYTAVQELATVVFYQNIARSAGKYDPKLQKLLLRLSKDESLHYAFYNQVVQLHLATNPDYIIEIANILINFQMPGAVLRDFEKRMELISEHTYGPVEYFDQVLLTLTKTWKLESIQPRSIEGQKSKEKLLRHVKKMFRIRNLVEKKKLDKSNLV